MTTRIFRKPKLESKEYLASLNAMIFEAEKKLLGLEDASVIAQTHIREEFEFIRKEKQAEIDALSSVLAIMQSERIELEKPITHKRLELDEREKKIEERAQKVRDDEQKALEREREAEAKLESVQQLADELGETRVRQVVKEKLLKGREDGLRDSENRHLLKIDQFNLSVRGVEEGLEERERVVKLRELNVNGKEENLEKREKELLNGHILLNDQRGTLARAWKELKQKQHGSTKRPKR